MPALAGFNSSRRSKKKNLSFHPPLDPQLLLSIPTVVPPATADARRGRRPTPPAHLSSPPSTSAPNNMADSSIYIGSSDQCPGYAEDKGDVSTNQAYVRGPPSPAPVV